MRPGDLALLRWPQDPQLSPGATEVAWSARDHLVAQSPLTYAPAIRTPVLLYVNDGDLRCPPGQSDEFYAGLRFNRKEVSYVRYPGGSHLSAFPTFGAPSQNEDRLRRILAWFGEHGGVPVGE